MNGSSTNTHGRFAPLTAAIRYGIAGLIVVAAVSMAIWASIAGLPGLWGALVGSGIGGAFILATVVTIYATRDVAPTATGAILLGSWLLKVIIAIAVMVAVRNMGFYDKTALVVTIVAVLVVMLAAETTAIVRTRTPYLDDPERGAEEPTPGNGG